MKRIIVLQGVRYLIRGNWTAVDISQLYDKYKNKYPDTKLTLRQWAVETGKVYCKLL